MIIVKTRDTRTKTRKKNTMNLNHKAVFLAFILSSNFSLNSVQIVKSPQNQAFLNLVSSKHRARLSFETLYT